MSETQPSSDQATGARGFVRRRPVAAFVVLSFALSWGFWLLFYVTSSPVMFFLGGLGPAMAGAVVAWQVGTLQSWLGRVLRWRVSPWFYLFAFGFPVLLYGVANVILAVFGAQPDVALLGQRLPAYAMTWVAALFLGGLEEPGWRGFALPRLQQQRTALTSSVLLGVVWGLWHIPLYLVPGTGQHEILRSGTSTAFAIGGSRPYPYAIHERPRRKRHPLCESQL